MRGNTYRSWLQLALVAVVATAVFCIVGHAIVDDAYIDLAYARNVAFSGHWGVTPGHTANTATSPLNVLILAAITFVVQRPFIALGLLFVASQVFLAWALVKTADEMRVPRWSALIAVGLLVLNPLLNSAVGLEIALSGAVLGFMLWSAVTRRPVWFGVGVGLLLLTRLDLVVVSVVIFLGFGTLRRHWWRIVVAAIATSLPWFAVSWVALGSAVPDTLLIKGAMGASQEPWLFAKNTLRIFDGFPVVAALSYVPAILGFVALVGWLVARLRGHALDRFRPVVLLGVGGVAHYGVYSVLNAPLFHWYYSWIIMTSTIVLAFTAGFLARRSSRPALRPLGLTLVGTSAAIIVCQGAFAVNHGVPWRSAAYNGNAALPAEYAAVGRGIAALVGRHAVKSPGEIGTIAYFCDCEVLDELSDRGVAVEILRKQRAQSGIVGRTILDLNFHFLNKNIQPTRTEFAIQYTHARPTSGHYWPTTGPSWIGNGYDVLDKIPLRPNEKIR